MHKSLRAIIAIVVALAIVASSTGIYLYVTHLETVRSLSYDIAIEGTFTEINYANGTPQDGYYLGTNVSVAFSEPNYMHGGQTSVISYTIPYVNASSNFSVLNVELITPGFQLVKLLAPSPLPHALESGNGGLIISAEVKAPFQNYDGNLNFTITADR